MKIAGVIAEFNPFHDGHAYLLQKARAVTGADYVVAVMSGNFVQRGMPAVMEKSLRVRAALTHGADAVFELPVRAAAGSADYFAEGAVHLLSALGVTDLCFGCETEDLAALQWIAGVLADEPAPFRDALKNALKNGLSYAAAMQQAAEFYAAVAGMESFSSRLSDLLSLPNSLLAISYLKALRKRGVSMHPHAILRRGAAYHADAAAPVAESLPSAASLRKLMKEACPAPEKAKANPAAGLFSGLRPYFREDLFSLYEPEFGRSFPLFADDFSLILGKTLLDLRPEEAYFDCPPDLYRRIYNHRRDVVSYDGFCQQIHTKQYPLASAQRGILHCMLGLKSDVAANAAVSSAESVCASYLPLLGFRSAAGPLLSEISRNSPLPLLSKTSEGRNLADPRALLQWEEIMRADALYRLARCCRFGRTFPLPEQAQIIVADG